MDGPIVRRCRSEECNEGYDNLLKEMIVVRDIANDISDGKEQMAFYTERPRGQDVAGWPVSVEELPDVQKNYAGWKLSQTVKMTAVYGWRGN